MGSSSPLRQKRRALFITGTTGALSIGNTSFTATATSGTSGGFAWSLASGGGQSLVIDPYGSPETVTTTSVSGGTVNFTPALTKNHLSSVAIYISH